MEIYWIGYYNGYTEGYNATTGGDGKQLFDHEAITARLKEFPYPIQVAQEFNCSPDLVRELCKKNQIVIKNYATDNKKRPVIQYTKSYEFLNRFDSIVEAGNWCYQNNLNQHKNLLIPFHFLQNLHLQKGLSSNRIYTYKPYNDTILNKYH